MTVYAVQPVGLDAAAVWLVEDGVHQVHLLRPPTWCPSGGGGMREKQVALTVAESLVGCHSTRKGSVAHSIGRISTRFG